MWEGVSVDILRLLLQQGDQKAIGRLSCTCSSLKAALYGVVDIWEDLAKGIPTAHNAPSEDQSRQKRAQQKLNQFWRVKNRMVTAQAKVTSLYCGRAPYVAGHPETVSSVSRGRDTAQEYNEADEEEMGSFSMLHNTGSDRTLCSFALESSGGSWEDKWIHSAKFLDSTDPSRVLQPVVPETDSLRRKREPRVFTDPWVMLGSRYVFPSLESNNRLSFPRFGTLSIESAYDCETAQEFDIDLSEASLLFKAFCVHVVPNSVSAFPLLAVLCQKMEESKESKGLAEPRRGPGKTPRRVALEERCLSIYDVLNAKFVVRDIPVNYTPFPEPTSETIRFVGPRVFIGSLDVDNVLGFSFQAQDGAWSLERSFSLPVPPDFERLEDIDIDGDVATFVGAVSSEDVDDPGSFATVTLVSATTGRVLHRAVFEDTGANVSSARGRLVLTSFDHGTLFHDNFAVYDIVDSCTRPLCTMAQSAARFVAPEQLLVHKRHVVELWDYGAPFEPILAPVVCAAVSKHTKIATRDLGKNVKFSVVTVDAHFELVEILPGELLAQAARLLNCEESQLTAVSVEHDQFVWRFRWRVSFAYLGIQHAGDHGKWQSEQVFE